MSDGGRNVLTQLVATRPSENAIQIEERQPLLTCYIWAVCASVSISESTIQDLTGGRNPRIERQATDMRVFRELEHNVRDARYTAT